MESLVLEVFKRKLEMNHLGGAFFSFEAGFLSQGSDFQKYCMCKTPILC